jgi:hypothetical protein
MNIPGLRRLTPAEHAALKRWQPRPVEPVMVDELLDRLEGVRRNGEGRWMARCPAHGDRSASLSVREGDGGRILLHCFSGCSFSEVVGALGLQPQQLFPPRDEPYRGPSRREREEQAERETRQAFWALQAARRPPTPERMKDELRLAGRLILGGTQAFRDLPEGFHGGRFQSVPLRLLFGAMGELVRQGPPRRWFSPLALSREFDRVEGAGSGKRRQVFFWARMAVHEAGR